jgi:hypothetical protein
MTTSAQAIAILLLTAGALGLSGCTDSKAEPQPTATVTMPAVTTQAAAPPTTQAPTKAQPGAAHMGNYSFKTDASIPQATFKVNESWTDLHFSVQPFKSAQCAVLQAEPPAGTGTGPQPQVTFTSPSGKKVGPISLGTYSSCDVSTNNKVGSTPAPIMGGSEQGTWKIDITGRGLNVYMHVSVLGT